MSGNNLETLFGLESGIHRIQRIPPTEVKGRRHTSTLGVSLFEYKDQEIKYDEKEFKVEEMYGTGPGGQNRNKNMTAIRVTHIPTKISAYSDTKSQKNNRRNAMLVALTRLQQRQRSINAKQKKEERLKQVGYVSRGTRIRTYNYIEDRVKDERINKKFSTKEIVEKGRLDLIYDQFNA